MRDRFSIGEMSKLHNVPIKTLRYYDEIGLFKPIEVDGNNGYRYYSIEQFEQLNTITYLKFLGLPLKEIKRHMEIRDVDSFLELLKKQREITEITMKRLALVNRQFCKRIEEIEGFLHTDLMEEPFLQTLPARGIISLQQPLHSEYEWEVALTRLAAKNKETPALIIGKVGLTVSKMNLYSNKFDEYNSIFILQEEQVEPARPVSYLPAGSYACIHYRGNHSQSAEYYSKLLHFIAEQGCEIVGDAIERTVINQYITRDNDKYITELQIPVLKPA